jgi:hypothetical protein
MQAIKNFSQYLFWVLLDFDLLQVLTPFWLALKPKRRM